MAGSRPPASSIAHSPLGKKSGAVPDVDGSKGKYAQYFQDERTWLNTREAATLGGNQERPWRSDFISAPEKGVHRFKKDPSERTHIPDRGGWSVRCSTSSFRSGGHEKDSTSHSTDKVNLKSWRNAALKEPNILSNAPIEALNDRGTRVAAAIGTLRKTEEILRQAAKTLNENRDTLLGLLFRDFEVLKETTDNLVRDRHELLKNVNTDLSEMRAQGRNLATERKFLLQEMQSEIGALEVKAYETQAEREDMLRKLQQARLQLVNTKDEVAEDPKLQSITNHWDDLELLHAALLKDRDTVFQQVMGFWPGIQYLAQHVRDDRRVVLNAVKPILQSETVQDACGHSSQLFWDCEAVVAAVTEDSASVNTMVSKLRQSRAIVQKVIQNDNKSLEKARTAMRSDRALVVAVVDNTMSNGKW